MKSIFVSSTFKDMQKERDLLRSVVLPGVNRQAKNYGESISFCDLRWGIDTTSLSQVESSETVLSACFEEIDRARPYMIVLLGDHYGFTPKKDIIRKELKKRKGFDLSDIDISYTQLEIEYGALMDSKSLKHTFFYFLELEGEDLPEFFYETDSENRARLERLKARIRAVAGDRVFTYKAKWNGQEVTGLESFTQRVQQDLLREFEPEWKSYASMDPYERIETVQKNYVKGLEEAFDRDKIGKVNPVKDLKAAKDILTDSVVTHDFNFFRWQKAVHSSGLSGIINSTRANKVFSVDRANLLGMEEIIVHGEPSKPLVITGEPGSGKTMTMLHICRIMEKCGFQVIEILCGSTSFLSSSKGVLLYLIWKFEKLMNRTHRYLPEEGKDLSELSGMIDMDEALDYMIELVETYSTDKSINRKNRVLIAVDGVDRLIPDEYRERLNFIPETLSEYVRAMLTVPSMENMDLYIKVRELPAPKEDERHNLIDGSLSFFGKQLAESVKANLVKKSDVGNPLYYYMAVARLTMIDAEGYRKIKELGRGIDAINAYMSDLIDKLPSSTKEMACELISASAEMVNPEVCRTAAYYLAVSRTGLRITDLEELLRMDNLNFAPVQFVQFVNYMNELFFVRENGAYDFFHEVIRAGLREELGERIQHQKQNLMEYLYRLPKEDELRQHELMYFVCDQGTGQQMFSLLAEASDYDESVQRHIASDVRAVLTGCGGNKLLEHYAVLAKQNIDDAVLPKAVLFLLEKVYPGFGDRGAEEETAYEHFNLLGEVVDGYHERCDSDDSRLFIMKYRSINGHYHLRFGQSQNLEQAWLCAAWAHDRFMDTRLTGKIEIENLREERDALICLYNVALSSDKNEYRSKINNLLRSMEKLLSVFPDSLSNEKDELKARLLCYRGAQLLRNGGPENAQMAGEALEEAYRIIKKEGQFHTLEHDKLLIEICMNLGDVIFEKRDKKSIASAAEYFSEALELSLKRRNRNKDLESTELTMKTYQRQASFIFEATEHTLSFFAFQKQEDALTSIGYCCRLAGMLNRRLESEKSRYVSAKMYHVNAVCSRNHNNTVHSNESGLKCGLKDLEEEMEVLHEMGDIFPYYDRDYAECAYEIGNNKYCLNTYGFKEVYEAAKMAYDIGVHITETDNSLENRLYRAKYALFMGEILARTGNKDNHLEAVQYVEEALPVYREEMFLRRNPYSKVKYAKALGEYVLKCERVGSRKMLQKAVESGEELLRIKEELKNDPSAGKLYTDLLGDGFVLKRVEKKLKAFE